MRERTIPESRERWSPLSDSAEPPRPPFKPPVSERPGQFDTRRELPDPFRPFSAARDSELPSRSFRIQAPRPGQNRISTAAWPASIRWETDYFQALKMAQQKNRPLFVKVGAEWCGFCKKMERETFADRRIIADISSGFVPVLLDADQDRQLAERLKVRSLPTVLVIAPDREILERQQGFRSAAQLSRVITPYLHRAQLIRPVKLVWR